jgi:hypothetical protein
VSAGLLHNIGDFWAATRDHMRRRSEVRVHVRDRSTGASRADVEADLRREFMAAGIPQTPEQIDAQVDSIVTGRLGLIERLNDAIRNTAYGTGPRGFRIRRHRLAGDRWTEVELSDDPAVRSTLRSTFAAEQTVNRHRPPALDAPSTHVRLVLLDDNGGNGDSGGSGGQRFGVFLAGRFVGMLPGAATGQLAPVIVAADARDERVVARTRIDAVGDLSRVWVALP